MATPCVFVDQATIGVFEMVNTYACDPWAVPHVVAPFLVGIMTGDPLFAWFMAYLAESVEVIMFQLLGSYELFIGDPDGNENLAGALVDDAFIQGGIGALLSLIYLYVFMYPRLLAWKDAWRGHSGRFWFYAFFLIFLMLPAVQYMLVVGTDEFKLGVLLMPFIVIAVICVFVLIQDSLIKRGKERKRTCSMESPWGNYPINLQREFWITASVFSLVMYLQELIPSWLYSSAVQTWLVSGVFAIYLGLRKAFMKPLIISKRRQLNKRDGDWIFTK